MEKKSKSEIAKIVDAQAKGRSAKKSIPTESRTRSNGDLDVRISKGKVERKSIS